MDLTQLANLGEFIGGVAVLVTLAYLAIQVRQGNSLARIQVHQQVARISTDSSWQVDTEAAALFRKAAIDFEALSSDERVVARSRFVAIVNYYEMLFYARRLGHVDDDLWASRVHRLRTNVGVFGPGLWQITKGDFGAAFQDFVDEEIMA